MTIIPNDKKEVGRAAVFFFPIWTTSNNMCVTRAEWLELPNSWISWSLYLGAPNSFSEKREGKIIIGGKMDTTNPSS